MPPLTVRLHVTRERTNKLSPLFIRLRSRVDPVTGCWNWIQSLQSAGYGQVRIETKTWLAHRASWVAHRGPIPNGMFVLHQCDNTQCCNPDHLFLGTAQDNLDDAIRKGRHLGGFPPGAVRLRRIRTLTDDDVRRIRSSTETAKELAAALGVGLPTIYNIRNGVRKQLVE